MEFEDYRQLDGVGLAEAVAKGETTAAELLTIAQARLAAVNPKINAIAVPMDAIAAERARQPLEGPFAGVPFLIKDIVQDYAGVPATAGSRAFQHRVPSEHAHMVRRWLQAGLVIFGKTTTPELALKASTETRLFGATRNPWDLSRTPGGSSGGAAAVVAAEVVPMAGANDGGGSIRIPAAMCGLVGLRPGRGRVSVGPAAGEVWEGANSDGIVCRSLRDAAVMLDVMAGPEPGDPFLHQGSPEPWASLLHKSPGKLRIAFSVRSPLGTPVDPEWAEATRQTLLTLEKLGHTVEEAEPAIDGRELAQAFFVMYFGQTAATVAEALARGARPRDFELDTRALALIGETISASEYVRWHRRWNGFARALARFYERYDLYVTPTLAQPPARIGEMDMPAWQAAALKPILKLGLGRVLTKSGVVDQMAEQQLARVPFTQLANLTGTPSLTLPLAQSRAGLPIGVLFNAPLGREDRLLQLGAVLEAECPWAQRRAPL